MAEIVLSSPDGKFHLRVDIPEVERLLSFCSDAGEVETGGVLLGRYNARHDTALVLDVLGPPSDSAQGRTWFRRGTEGLQRIVDRLWRTRREHYLGEWHFHPFAAPPPSSIDYDQMEEIALSPSWRCPEPVLLIIGGDPHGEWRPYGLVTTRGKERIHLRASDWARA